MRGHLLQLRITTTLLAVWCLESEHAIADSTSTPSVTLTDLRTEYRANPLGIDVGHPRFSWLLRSERRGTIQSAYQIRVALSEAALNRGVDLLWDSEKVISRESIHVSYAGPPLKSRQRYYWRVRVWNERGTASEWSRSAWWEMGLLRPSDWSGQWIEPLPASEQVAMMRRWFTVRGNVQRARAYVTSRGLYQLFLNGHRVGDAELTPGFTSYNKRLQYQTYDVTDVLKPGDNAIGAFLGEGWYSERFGFNRRNNYGNRPALLVQVEVTYENGLSDLIVTDEIWKSSPGPILMSDIYAGETYDARLEQADWNRSTFDDSNWIAIRTTNASKSALVAESTPPVRKIEQIAPKSIVKMPTGQMIVDMGQNMVGWVRLSAQGPRGTTVTLRHAEILDSKGNLYTENLRSAKQTIRYTLKGEGLEVYEPHFTFQGFRYVEVLGYPGELTPEKITGIVLHSDFNRISDFETSSPLLNKLQQNIVWGLRGNFIDIPTDCPQRDERLGWTGDAQVFAPTAAFNADVAGFFSKWLKDAFADQYATGSIPWVVPDVIREIDFKDWEGVPNNIRKKGKHDAGGAAGWGDAVIVIPWTIYLSYGDRRPLEQHYENMVRWVEYERKRAGDDLIWSDDFQFGDWLDFDSANRNNFGKTSTDLIATAYFAHSADLLSRTAEVLGKKGDAALYAKLFSDVRLAFQHRFVSADGKVGTGSQTAYALSLQFGLLTENQRAAAAKHLADDVRGSGHLTTGFLGTPWLLFALSENAYLEEAYRLLIREKYPSWLYPVKRGATTTWERWDGVKPDGSFQNPGMNSFNHYAYGAVGNWMYSVIAGINTDLASPGYKHVLIRPRPGGGLTTAKVSHITPYGRVSTSWRIQGGIFQLSVVIPPNATATVTLPAAEASQVLEGGKPVSVSDGITEVRNVESDVIVKIGSGQYAFSYDVRSD